MKDINLEVVKDINLERKRRGAGIRCLVAASGPRSAKNLLPSPTSMSGDCLSSGKLYFEVDGQEYELATARFSSLALPAGEASELLRAACRDDRELARALMSWEPLERAQQEMSRGCLEVAHSMLWSGELVVHYALGTVSDVVSRNRPGKPSVPKSVPPPPGQGPPGPAAAKPPPPTELTWFEARVVDEIGEPLDGLAVQLEAAGQHERTTGTDGSARVDDVLASSGSICCEDLDSLREILKQRWDEVREDEWFEPGEPATSFIPLRNESPKANLLSERPHTLVIQPWVIRARLIGMYFDLNKCFLLPTAMAGIRGIKTLYDENPGSKLLVVGHTDTLSSAWYNDPLSVERAESVAAYLTDNVNAWLTWYTVSDNDKRWGGKEDQLMISGLPDFPARPAGESPVRWFQRTRGLTVDGAAGIQTRRALVRDYMAIDGTSLPAGVSLTIHGCGENFPMPDGLPGEDSQDRNRRVELYFFDGHMGIQPPVHGKNSQPGSTEYPEWVRRAQETYDFREYRATKTVMIRLIDADDVALVNAPFAVEIGGMEYAGHCDDEGRIRVDLPEAMTSFRLIVSGREHILTVVTPDAFPRADQPDGARERLNNLGYRPGASSSQPTSEMKTAVTYFQADHELKPTGDLDAVTRNELAKIYGFGQ